jgi:hypothetical protein
MRDINGAIQKCIDQCRGADAPLAVLSRYSAELRQAGWSDADVRAVESGVVRFLSALSNPDLPVSD